MAIRLRIARSFWTNRIGRVLFLTALGLVVTGTVTGLYIWFYYGGIIDQRLKGSVFESRSSIFAAPELVTVGEARDRQELVAQLRRFGYSNPDMNASDFGRFELTNTGIDIHPGPSSRVGPEYAARIDFAAGKVSRITSLRDRSPRNSVWVDPALVTNLFDSRRTKRRLVLYEEIPPHLINAVLAAEDRRFFDHPGISYLDAARALWYDIGIWTGKRKGARPQGASTLTMQLARSFFLTRELSYRRKAAEIIIALQLERRFEKEKIFELYANEIYLGQRGSFTIHGFGEAARAYFDKDISQLTLAESALLAGIIRGPSYYSPFRKPQNAVPRRNYVLDAMVETGAITAAEANAAKQTPIKLAPANIEASEAPYFVDLVRDKLLEKYSEEELVNSDYRIHSTLDLRLQAAAAAAVRDAMPEVDAKIKERYRRSKEPPPEVQVTLVALDPRTGAVKALVGGRDYTRTQLNRAVAPRQPGSAFKPFVFAAAFATGLEDPEGALTTVTTVVDEPTIFEFEGQQYEPSNFGEQFYGVVTLREALVRSLNVATVKVAEMAGYGRVADVAVAAGLNPRLRPTPAISLGAYDSTPLEVAGAYTVFANLGTRVDPILVDTVISGDGQVLENATPRRRPAMDPRVAYLVVDVLRDVMNRGTGAGARSRGFVAPAAGKTGTSRDAWFAGFTSSLLCVVWVGFDDARDLGLPGSTAALPVWTAFMKRAVAIPPYTNVEDFAPPDGIVSVPIDVETLQVATPECTNVRYERFILGTEPTELCPRHRPQSVFRPVTRTLLHLFGAEKKKPQPAAPPASDPAVPSPPQAGNVSAAPPAPRQPGNLLEAYFGDSKSGQPGARPTSSKKPAKRAGVKSGGG
ncbi:MAG: penicillin-binding protein 1A [Candidatus Acidiferrales bacterium]